MAANRAARQTASMNSRALKQSDYEQMGLVIDWIAEHRQSQPSVASMARVAGKRGTFFPTVSSLGGNLTAEVSRAVDSERRARASRKQQHSRDCCLGGRGVGTRQIA